MGQLLSLGLGKIKQPKVIAEVLGGILLGQVISHIVLTAAHQIVGPTAMGRIPGFTEHIFPSQSLPYLSLVANIGLCLFLFIVGLEIDVSVIKRSVRSSLFIALSAMALSFGLGASISVPLYHTFIPSSVKYTYFMLFTGVSFSITAFPVLCRILTALKLLDTTVGIVVLSAGVCNDVVGWSLLALAVALVNATSGLTALWILLTCIAFTAFLMWPVRIALLRFARFTGSTENGPTMFFMTVTILVMWACSFFTDIVGVNAIFGK
jgi:Kef-type K+ transport system membrane component KefB